MKESIDTILVVAQVPRENGGFLTLSDHRKPNETTEDTLMRIGYEVGIGNTALTAAARVYSESLEKNVVKYTTNQSVTDLNLPDILADTAHIHLPDLR